MLLNLLIQLVLCSISLNWLLILTLLLILLILLSLVLIILLIQSIGLVVNDGGVIDRMEIDTHLVAVVGSCNCKWKSIVT